MSKRKSEQERELYSLVDSVNRDRALIMTLSTLQLEQLIDLADEKYYNSDESIFTDETYDKLKARLSAIMPTAASIGREPSSHKKVELPYHLGSMDKIKEGDRELSLWFGRYRGPYVVSTKVDGVSALYIRDKRGEPRLYTRGDGKVGTDISHLIPHLGLPALGDLNGVRGELIIPKSVFRSKRFQRGGTDKFYENARNAVSGLVNSLEDRYNRELADITHFVAYEHIKEEGGSGSGSGSGSGPQLQDRPSRQLSVLASHGFKVVEYRQYQTLDENELEQLFDRYLMESSYEIDGLIVHADLEYRRNVSGNPEYARAYKRDLDALIATTKVLDVEWNLSRTKYFKPILILEPVSVDNVTIGRATGYNAKYIVDNGIGRGALVKIIRSGGVIPKVLEVIQTATPLLPDAPFRWGKSGVDIILDQEGEQSSPILGQLQQEARVKSISYFLTTLGVAKIGEKTVEQVYGLLRASLGRSPNLNEFLRVDQRQISSVGPKTSKMIPENIRESLRGATTNKVAAASGLFGRGVGERKVALITDAIPNFWRKYSPPFDKREIKSELTRVDGISDITASMFSDNYQLFYLFFLSIRDLLDPSNIQDGPEPYSIYKLAAMSGIYPNIDDASLRALLSPIKAADELNSYLTQQSSSVNSSSSSRLRRAPVDAKVLANFRSGLPQFIDYIGEIDRELISNLPHVEQQIGEDIIIDEPTSTPIRKPTRALVRRALKSMPKTVVLTDLKGKAEYERAIRARGGTVGSSVTRSTDLVVIGHAGVSSLKRAAAERLHIPVVTLDEFERDYLTDVADADMGADTGADLDTPITRDDEDEVIITQDRDEMIIEDDPIEGAIDRLDRTFTLKELQTIGDTSDKSKRRAELISKFRSILEPVEPDSKNRHKILANMIKRRQMPII